MAFGSLYGPKTNKRIHNCYFTFVKCYFISYLYITRSIKTHSFHVLIFRSIFDFLIPFLFVSCRINVDRTYGGVGFNLSMCETYLSSGEVSAPSLRTIFFVRLPTQKVRARGIVVENHIGSFCQTAKILSKCPMCNE